MKRYLPVSALLTSTLLISALFLAVENVCAEKTDLPTNNSDNIVSADNHATMDTMSADSVSGGDADMNFPADIPEQDPDAIPPAGIPEQDPDAIPPAGIPEQDPDAIPPVSISTPVSDSEYTADTPKTDFPENTVIPAVSVSAPSCLDFIMDPYELAGQGDYGHRNTALSAQEVLR